MRRQIGKLVERELATYKYAPSEKTLGTPWPEQKVLSYIDKLRGALVTPYVQRFTLQDTVEQMRKSPPDKADYWVVAETEQYIEFYDPSSNEYGLADFGSGEELAKTIGVRGDLVGTFCAM